MLKQGDEVYLARTGGWETYYTKGKVVKVTPSGAVDVLIGSSMEPTRFRPDGYKQGGDRYRDYQLDHIPFVERTALLEQWERAKHAAAMIRSVVPKDGVNARWDKEGLTTEVTRLQTLLDTAKAAVEAI